MTRYLFKITKNLLSLPLLISASASLAATFTYHVLNSGDSVNNPVTITNAYFMAQSRNYPECSTMKSFSNSKVTTGQETILTYDPEMSASCYGPDGVYSQLHIQTVDGKGNNQDCWRGGQTFDPSGSVYVGAIKIIETYNYFYCEYPVGQKNNKEGK